jgi:Ca-activated chloride channel family protein
MPRPLTAFCLLLFVLFGGPARASALHGALQVLVVDDGGLGVPGTAVTATSPVLIGGSMTQVTDEAGGATFPEVPPGAYELRADHVGFGTVRQPQVIVYAGQTSHVTLMVRYGGEAVEVVAPTGPRAAAPATSTLTSDFLARIPTGRSYQDAVSNTAGISGGGNPSSAGASYNENVLSLDRYNPINEGGFRATVDSPLSTFSIDVDTASYANVRRFLQEGALPPHDAVRIEELVNYFDYDDAPPAEGAALVARAEVTSAPWAEGHRLVRIGIRGRAVPTTTSPSRNLVFLVDVSGSMAPRDRLPLLQQGLRILVDQLDAHDHVALVVYAGRSAVVLPPTPGDRHAALKAAIDELSAGGSTAGSAGIRTAYDLARRNFEVGAVNRVILATDGDFNVGEASPGGLVELIRSERASGVYLSVLGVGRGNLQDGMMEQLADAGNGNYAVLDNIHEAQRVLGESLSATLVPVAKDVKLQVEFNPARVSRYRLIGYEDRALADRDFLDDAKDAGELGAGQTVTALYEVELTGEGDASEVAPLRYQSQRARTAAARSPELLDVHVRYQSVDGGPPTELSLPVVDEGGAFASASTDTRWSAAVAAFGMLLRDSPNRGAIDWDWVRHTARDALGEDARGDRAELLGLIERARRMAGAP